MDEYEGTGRGEELGGSCGDEVVLPGANTLLRTICAMSFDWKVLKNDFLFVH